MTAEIDLRKIYGDICKLLVVFITCDNARLCVAIPHIVQVAISLLRDFFFFTIVVILITINAKKIFPKFAFFALIVLPVCYFMFFCNCFLGLSETSFMNLSKGFYWYLRPILIFVVFYNYMCITNKNIDCLVTLFLKVAVLLFFVSAFIYFFCPFMVSGMHFQYRISLGNPSMIAAVYVGAAIVLLHFQPFSEKKNFLFFLIYVVANLATMCATSNLIMFLLILLSCFSKRTRKFGNAAILILVIAVAAFFTFTKSKEAKLLFEFVQKRLNEITSVLMKYIFHQSDSINSDSFRGRESQLSRMIKSYPKSGYFMGIGDISGTQGAYSLENIYMATFSNYGFLGLGLYIAFLLSLFVKSIYQFVHKHQVTFLMFTIFLSLYGMTLDLINTYSLSGIFVLTGYLLWADKKFDFAAEKDGPSKNYKLLRLGVKTK